MTVPYRPGLPSVEDVRAHERRGGWWMSRFTGPGDKIAPQVRRLFVDRKGQIRASEDADEYGMTASTIAIERRPCSPEGDPMDWPGTPAAPPAVVEFQTKRAPVKDPAGVTLPARLRCLVCGQYVGDDTLLIPAGYLHFSCIDDMARVPRPGAPPAGPVLDREGLTLADRHLCDAIHRISFDGLLYEKGSTERLTALAKDLKAALDAVRAVAAAVRTPLPAANKGDDHGQEKRETRATDRSSEGAGPGQTASPSGAGSAGAPGPQRQPAHPSPTVDAGGTRAPSAVGPLPAPERDRLIALCGEWEERAQILSRTGRPVMAAGIRECAGRLRALLTGTTGTGGADGKEQS